MVCLTISAEKYNFIKMNQKDRDRKREIKKEGKTEKYSETDKRKEREMG